MKLDMMKFRHFFSGNLSEIGYFFHRLARQLYIPVQEVRVAPWVVVEGDKTLRVDYPLSPDSVVFDVGGYEGQWASDIFSRYFCQIHIFEPVHLFASRIERRFAENPKIIVHPFGLSNQTREEIITVNNDGSSLFKPGSQTETIQLVRAANFIREHNISQIDLMKINIEGSEYDLLEDLIGSGLVEKITNIQVQFHDFIPDASQRMTQIQNNLQQTHALTYQYPFVWENWRRKDS